MVIDILLLILVILSLVGLSILYMSATNNKHASVCFLLMVMSFIIIVIICFYNSEPKAMDVYQGKTTLKYTIIDGIKTDSVVIFKNDK